MLSHEIVGKADFEGRLLHPDGDILILEWQTCATGNIATLRILRGEHAGETEFHLPV